MYPENQRARRCVCGNRSHPEASGSPLPCPAAENLRSNRAVPVCTLPYSVYYRKDRKKPIDSPGKRYVKFWSSASAMPFRTRRTLKKHRRDQILPVSAFTTSKGIVSEIAVSWRTIPRNNSNTAFLIDAATPDFYGSSSNTGSPDDSLGNTDRSVPDREAFTAPRFSPDTFITRLPLPAGKPSVCKINTSSVTGVKTTKNSALIFRFIRKARLPQLTAWNPQSSLPHRVSNPLLRNMR